MSDETRETTTKADRLVKLLTPANSEGYAAAAVRLRDARRLFHEIVAVQTTNPLNAAWQQTPHETLQEKQEAARWINAELRSLGIAIRGPKTGEAALIHADPVPYNHSGRFQVLLTSTDLGRKRTFSSATPFKVELIPHYERREPLAERWTTKT